MKILGIILVSIGLLVFFIAKPKEDAFFKQRKFALYKNCELIAWETRSLSEPSRITQEWYLYAQEDMKKNNNVWEYKEIGGN